MSGYSGIMKYPKAIVVLLALLIIALGVFWVNQKLAHKGQPLGQEGLGVAFLLDRPVDELPIVDHLDCNRLSSTFETARSILKSMRASL